MLLSSVTLKKVKEGEVTAGSQSRPSAAARRALAKRSLACCCCHGRIAPTAWEETHHVSRAKEKVGIFSKGDMI